MGFAETRRQLVNACLAMLCCCCFQSTAPALDDPLLLKNATLHTLQDDSPVKGDLLIVDGKIEAMGTSVKAPDNAREIDLTGCQITPGLIDSRGKLWMTANSLADKSSKAELNVTDAIDPWSEDWRELAAQGITTVYVQPSSQSTFGGYGAVLKVGHFGSPDSIVLKHKAALQASIGVTGATSKDRFAQVKALEKLMESAKKELEKRKKEEKNKKDKSSKSDEKPQKSKPSPDKDADSDDKKSAKPKQDDDKKADAKTTDKEQDADKTNGSPSQEALILVLKKEIPLHVEVHHSDALKQILKVGETYDVRLVLDGLSQVESNANDLQPKSHPIVVGPFQELTTPPGYRKSASRKWLADWVSKPGQMWAISGFPSRGIASRLLRVQAAAAIASGIDRGEVLEALTVHPARMLGVGEVTGSLAKGKRADLAVFAGDPLNPGTPVVMTLCEGQPTFEALDRVPQTPATEPTEVTKAPEPMELPESFPARYQLKSTRILQADGSFKPGTLAIADGKIVDAVDEGTPTFDVGDRVITAGFVSGFTTLGQAENLTDTSDSDASHLRAIDGLDLKTKLVSEMLAAGFIHAAVAPGLTNTSAGLTGHVRLGADQPIANPSTAGVIVMAGTARDNGRYPASLGGQVQMLEGLFNELPLPTRLYLTDDVAALMNQAKQKNLQMLRQGKRKTILVADREVELASALQLVESYELQGAILCRSRLDTVADELAKHSLAVIVPPLNGSEYQSQLDQYPKLEQCGVRLVFSGDSPKQIRTTATLLVSAGLSPEAALQGLTSNGEISVGMNPVSLTPGQAADLVIWSDHPLDLSSQPVGVMVDGQRVPQEK